MKPPQTPTPAKDPEKEEEETLEALCIRWAKSLYLALPDHFPDHVPEDPADLDAPCDPAQLPDDPDDDSAYYDGHDLPKAVVTVKVGLDRVVVEVGKGGRSAWEVKESLEAVCGVPASSQLLYGPGGLLGDLDVLRPADHLLLLRATRLPAGGKKKTGDERRKDKPKAPKRPAPSQGGPSRKAKKNAERDERRMCRREDMETMWRALLAGKADPGEDAAELTPAQARDSLVVYRGIHSAAAAQARKTPGTSVTAADRADMLARIQTAREMISVEGRLLGKRGKEDRVILRKQQEIVAGLVQEVMVRGLVAMADCSKVTISRLTLQFLHTHVVEQTLLLELHKGKENVTYTEAEGDKCFELAAQFVADNPVPLRTRDLSSILREARSALVAAPDAARPAVPDSSNTAMDTAEHAADPAPDQSEPMVTEVNIGDEEVELEPVVETAQARVVRQREERRRAFVPETLAYLKKELAGKSLDDVEGWFGYLLGWFRRDMELPSREELCWSEFVAKGETPTKPLGKLLFDRSEDSPVAATSSRPTGFHNPGTLCFLAPAFQIVCDQLSRDDLRQTPPKTQVAKEGDEEEEPSARDAEAQPRPPTPEAQPDKDGDGDRDEELSPAAVVVAALRAHVSAAKVPNVKAINLYGLALALVAYRPHTFGDPSRLEMDWSDALLSLLAALDEVFVVSPIRHVILTKRLYVCPLPRPPAAACKKTWNPDVDPHSFYNLHLMALLEPEELELDTPLRLVPLLEKAANIKKEWSQGCCSQMPDGHDKNGKAKTKPHTTGHTLDTVTELPLLLVVKIGRQMDGTATKGLCKRPLVVGGAVVDLAKAVSVTPASDAPLLYTAKSLVLKSGNQSGHFVTVSATANGRIFLIDDDKVAGAERELDDWAAAFPGVNSFFVDAVVLESVKAAAARVAASETSVPRPEPHKPYVLHPSPEYRKAGGVMALVKTGAVRDVLGDDDVVTQKAVNLGLLQLGGPLREGCKLVEFPERVDPERNSLLTLSHAPGEKLVAEKRPLDSRLLSPLPYEAPARTRRTPLFKARQLRFDEAADTTTEAVAKDTTAEAAQDTTAEAAKDSTNKGTVKDTTIEDAVDAE